MDGFQGWAGAVATLLLEKGDRCGVPYLSYHKETVPGRWMPENWSQKSLLCKCRHKSHHLECRVVGSNPGQDFDIAFSSIFFNLCQFWAQWSAQNAFNSLLMWEIVIVIVCIICMEFSIDVISLQKIYWGKEIYLTNSMCQYVCVSESGRHWERHWEIDS